MTHDATGNDKSVLSGGDDHAQEVILDVKCEIVVVFTTAGLDGGTINDKSMATGYWG